MSGGPNEFTKRALTGAVYVALTLGAAIAGRWTTFMLFLPVCVIGAREWHRLYHTEGESDPGAGSTMLLAAVAFLSIGVQPMMESWSMFHAVVVLVGALVVLAFDLMRRSVKDPAHAFAGHIATVVYVALPFASVTWLVEMHWHVFVGFMFLLWTSDTGAYLLGKAIGRTKLMPSVSPGKTCEGLAGGVALTMLVGWVLSHYWFELTSLQWMAGAAAVATTATLGDLLESAFKRARGVKDSGTLLPGHGGILDRFDGYLLAAPSMMMITRLLG